MGEFRIIFHPFDVSWVMCLLIEILFVYRVKLVLE